MLRFWRSVVRMKELNKHYAGDLEQMQSLSLISKIRMSQFRIRDWYEAFDGNVYVSRSGGKDSDVLGHLVKELYPDVPQVFVNTGLELESVREHGKSVADTVLYPSLNFKEVILRYGYPVVSKEVSQVIYECQTAKRLGKEYPSYHMEKLTGTKLTAAGEKSPYNMEKYHFLLNAPFRISNKCCDIMKKASCKRYEKETGRKPFIGTMAGESRLRYQKWLKFGCNAFGEKRQTSQPLSFWTERDILQYLKDNAIQIAEAYGDICYEDENGLLYKDVLIPDNLNLTTTKAKRTGCAFCLYGASYDERFLLLRETEPKKYRFVMDGGEFDSEGMWIPNKKGLGFRFVIDWLNENGQLNIKY